MGTRGPLTEAEKQLIPVRKGQGVPLREIATELACSFETVRKWWRYQRDQRKCRPRGRPTQGMLSSYHPYLVSEAVRLKRAHPHWGPPMVRLELQSQFGLCRVGLPSDARLSALFKQECPEAVQPHRPQAYPEKSVGSTDWVHQRWQIDAKEAVRLGEREYANILDIRDPAGALIIASQAFLTTHQHHWRKLHLWEIQSVLRQAFQTWGKPLEIQTDRETVYVGSADHNFPSPFTLWLVGLGIRHVASRSHRPTDQAQVERNHRTLAEMAWKDSSFTTLAEFQEALDRHRQRYNQQYPSRAAGCQGQAPLAVHPWACSSGRSYHPALEWGNFDLERVHQFLSQQVWIRQVTSTGVGIFGDHRYYVGRDYRGQKVSGLFVPERQTFAFYAKDGTFIRELPAAGCQKEDLIGSISGEVHLPIGFQLPLPLQGV